MTKKQLMSTGEFAVEFGYTVPEVLTLIRGGELPATMVAGRYAIDLEEVKREAPDVLDGPDDEDGDADDEAEGDEDVEHEDEEDEDDDTDEDDEENEENEEG